MAKKIKESEDPSKFSTAQLNLELHKLWRDAWEDLGCELNKFYEDVPALFMEEYLDHVDSLYRNLFRTLFCEQKKNRKQAFIFLIHKAQEVMADMCTRYPELVDESKNLRDSIDEMEYVCML